MILLLVLFNVVIAFLCYHAWKYANPYKLYMVFGKKGSGKTTLMVKLSIRYRKKGWKVFCDREIPGCYRFDTADFGKIQFPPNSLILVDEVGLVWDNRNFKSFPEHVKRYFKYQRQYRNVVYLFSQSFDVDKKIRDLTDHLYIVTNVFNCFSVARRVTKKVTIVHADRSAQGESRIADDYELDPILFAPFGTVRLTYIPKYVRYFKSYDPPTLDPYEGEALPELPSRRSVFYLLSQLRNQRSVLKLWNRRR